MIEYRFATSCRIRERDVVEVLRPCGVALPEPRPLDAGWCRRGVVASERQNGLH